MRSPRFSSPRSHGAHEDRPRRYATGSDRRAAMVAGVRHLRDYSRVFACSGMLAALAGSLLSYSLAAASGVALTDVLVPAIAAAIIGGVSLMGGKARRSASSAACWCFVS